MNEGPWEEGGEIKRRGYNLENIHVEMCMFLLEYVWMCKHGIAWVLR